MYVPEDMKRQQMGQYFHLSISRIDIFYLYYMAYYYFYIYTRRIAVLLFSENAVSRIAVPVSPYPSRRIGAS